MEMTRVCGLRGYQSRPKGHDGSTTHATTLCGTNILLNSSWRQLLGRPLIRDDVEHDCRWACPVPGHLRFVYRLGGHLNDCLGGRDNDQLLGSPSLLHYFVLTGKRGLSCSPNLECLKLLSCRLTSLQIVVGMVPSSRGPGLTVAAAQRQVLEDGDAMPSLAD